MKKHYSPPSMVALEPSGATTGPSPRSSEGQKKATITELLAMSPRLQTSSQ